MPAMRPYSVRGISDKMDIRFKSHGLLSNVPSWRLRARRSPPSTPEESAREAATYDDTRCAV